MNGKMIRTLVVDDSVFMRTVLKSALDKARHIDVIGSAQNGAEALQKIASLKPDVVTLDIEMPGVDGLEVLRRVMSEHPLPIVMVSTKTQDGAELTFKALELGAVDYVAKPLSDPKASLRDFQEQVIRAIETAFLSNRAHLKQAEHPPCTAPRAPTSGTDRVLVAIGISAGGPATLHKLIPTLPADFAPIVLTQHMPAEFTQPFANRLNATSHIEVKQAESGDEIRPGRLLMAPGDAHLKVVRRGGRGSVTLDRGPKVSGFRPSVDVMFKSVAKAYGQCATCAVMTGMGWDGAEGIRKLKKVGAYTIAQDQASSIVYGMPKAAFETGCIDQVASLADMPNALADGVNQCIAHASQPVGKTGTTRVLPAASR